MKKSKMRKTWIAILTALCMVFTMIPAVGFAGSTTDSSVTVYVSVSEDGNFVTGADGTVMARVPVTVEYFPLSDYGLEEYNRYEGFDSSTKKYTNSDIVEEPTALHLYITVLEQYYLGGKDLSVGSVQDALSVSGGAASLFMTRFWGHDCNLMYYLNEKYPLMFDGWGATADYMLLKDDDCIDIAMYTDWNFYGTGAFSYFDQKEKAVEVGEAVKLNLYGVSTASVNDGEQIEPAPMPNEVIRISKDKGQTWDEMYDEDKGDYTYYTDENGNISLSFDEVGEYWISAGYKDIGYTYDGTEYDKYGFNGDFSDAAPPICKVTVTEAGGTTTPEAGGNTGEGTTTPEAGGGGGGGATVPEAGDEPTAPEAGEDAEDTPEVPELDGSTSDKPAAPEAGGDANDAPAAPEAGDVVTDPETGAEFEVTDTDEGEKSVAFVGTEDSGDKKVTIPATVVIDGEKYKVTSIDNGAFKGNKDLKTVKVSKNVETIGKNAFKNCTQLKTVKLGKNVEVIGKNAFSGCTSLRSIVIPANVEKIDTKAFFNAKKLKKITIKTDKLSRGDIGKNAFKGTPDKAVVKAPKGKAADYERILKGKGLHNNATVK